MDTFKESVALLGLKEEEFPAYIENLDSLDITKEKDLLNYLSTDETKYKDFTEMYLRSTKLIIYEDMDINQASNLYRSIAKDIPQKDRLIIESFFIAATGDEFDVMALVSAFAKRMEIGNHLECVSLINYVRSEAVF
jgi:hypothetical protein